MKIFIKFIIAICFSGYQHVFSQTNITDSIFHQSFQRKFMVHFPPNFDTALKRPLVLNLHGGSGNMVTAQGFSQFNPVADEFNFVVAWPQGIGIAPPGFSWADGRNTSADMAGIDDVDFIDKLIDTLITRYNIDTTRIYICGFSNGGFMVQRIACEKPQRYAAMASLGSSIDTARYQNCNPAKPIPFAFFNGTADPAMPYLGGPMQNPLVIPVVPVDSTIQFWVKNNNCKTALPVFNIPDAFDADSSTAELYEFTDCDCNSTIKFFKLINGGHTWPGVYIQSQESVLGTTNRDINASSELCNFFNSNSLCISTESNINKIVKNPFNVYPNPTSSKLHLNIDIGNEFEVNISNIYGQIVYLDTNRNTIDVSMLSNGIYFLTITNKLFKHQIKFIKE